MQKMFSQDFKMHCECIDAFTSLMKTQPEAILEILDLIYKWTAIKLADSGNTKFAVNIFDFYAHLFSHIQEQQYQLQDFEAAILIPLLCEKTSLNNNILKEKVKKLIKILFSIYSVQSTYNMIIQNGLTAKSLVAQAECLDEIADFIQKQGINYCGEKEMKLIAKMADSPAKDVRENALKVLGEAY